MKRDIIRLPQCHVAYNIMYNANNTCTCVHMDHVLRGVSILYNVHVHVHVYTCTYIVLQLDDCVCVYT